MQDFSADVFLIGEGPRELPAPLSRAGRRRSRKEAMVYGRSRNRRSVLAALGERHLRHRCKVRRVLPHHCWKHSHQCAGCGGVCQRHLAGRVELHAPKPATSYTSRQTDGIPPSVCPCYRPLGPGSVSPKIRSSMSFSIEIPPWFCSIPLSYAGRSRLMPVRRPDPRQISEHFSFMALFCRILLESRQALRYNISANHFAQKGRMRYERINRKEKPSGRPRGRN